MTSGIEYHLTAEEAWPAFERHVLSARRRVVAGFRVFDPMTLLRSDEGREIGRDWFDLLVHVLRQGVRFDLILSDFDPIIAPDMHRQTWYSMRIFAAIREAAGPGALICVIPALHPAEAGTIAELALWPKVRQEVHDVRDWLNGMSPEERGAAFADLPGTRPWLRLGEDGQAETHGARSPELHPASHHHKIAVIDGEVLYVGGLDLNPRRYDTKRHHRAAKETWHDVQVSVRGAVAGTAEAHLDGLLDVVAGRAEPVAEENGFRTTLSRVRPTWVSLAPEIVRRSIADTHMERVAAAGRLLYFESQFFRDRELADAIARRAEEAPDLEVLMILPAAPEVVAFDKRDKLDARFGEYLQAQCVRQVMDAFGDRAYFASPAQKRAADGRLAVEGDRSTFHGAPLVYVHAKVSVFDRRATLVSSANLNSRSLHWDTEAGLFVEDAAFARHVIGRSLRHWLPETEIDPAGPLVAAVRDQAELDAARQPENRSGYLLPYDVSKAEEFGTNLPGIPAELV
jgi:hypothetical protein